MRTLFIAKATVVNADFEREKACKSIYILGKYDSVKGAILDMKTWVYALFDVTPIEADSESCVAAYKVVHNREQMEFIYCDIEEVQEEEHFTRLTTCKDCKYAEEELSDNGLILYWCNRPNVRTVSEVKTDDWCIFGKPVDEKELDGLVSSDEIEEKMYE